MNTRQHIRNKRRPSVNFIRRGKRFTGTAKESLQEPQEPAPYWPFPTGPAPTKKELDDAYDRAMGIL